jgi:RNA polymerase sigma-70 factor, ECF subfamily
MTSESRQADGVSDELLACRVQAGCRESAAELYQRFRPRLLYVLEKRLLQRSDAEDVVQQTMVRVIEHIDSYDLRQRFSPWIFTIALRLTTDLLRRRGRSRIQQNIPLALVDHAVPPDRQVMDREQRDLLWRLAETVLTPEQWTALWLFYGEGYSAKEVARAMGRASVSVRVLLYRGRKALEPHLNDHANLHHKLATGETTFQDDYRMSRMLARTYHDSHIA